MTMTGRTIKLASLVLFLTPVFARAWGPVGHKAVGLIAQNRLSPEALKTMEGILGPGVGLDRISNCADKIIYGEQNCADAFTITVATGFGTMPWHFINIPVTADADESSMMDFCPEIASCVVARIRKNVLVLQDPTASLDDKRTALMFLVHFVGDVHQPLHGSNGDPHDQGGGFKKMPSIIYQGKPMSLHSIWDSALDEPAENDFRLPDPVLTSRARKLVDRLEERFMNDASVGAWSRGDIASKAALESHSLARAIIYPDYDSSQGNDRLSDYQSRLRFIAEQRVYMAGVRLASLLETVREPIFVPVANGAAMHSSAERVQVSLEDAARALQ